MKITFYKMNKIELSLFALVVILLIIIATLMPDKMAYVELEGRYNELNSKYQILQIEKNGYQSAYEDLYKDYTDNQIYTEWLIDRLVRLDGANSEEGI